MYLFCRVQSVLGWVTVFGRANHSGQLSLLSIAGWETHNWPKCSDALRMRSKGRHGSFHLWMHVWVTGETVWSLINTCHNWAPYRWVAQYTVPYKCMPLLMATIYKHTSGMYFCAHTPRDIYFFACQKEVLRVIQGCRVYKTILHNLCIMSALAFFQHY